MSDRKKIVLLGGSRTPITDFGRGMGDVKADVMAEHVMRHAMRRAGITPAQLDGVVFGQAYQSPEAPNIARHVFNSAGWPNHVVGDTVQKQCGSGMRSINLAMNEIWLGYGDVFLAGGAESMSTIPYFVDGALRFKGRRSQPFNSFATQFAKGFMPKVIDWLSRRMANGWFAGKWNGFFANASKYGPRPYIGVVEDGLLPSTRLWDTKTTNMSQTAQLLADNYGITREQMDEYALRSQQLALAAIQSGRFAEEIDPILTGKGLVAVDEHPRQTSMEKLAKLRGANRTKHITAGNASGINDGACAVVLASEEFAQKNGLSPLAVLVDHAHAGVDYEQMGLGPVAAITKLLERNGLTVADIDLIELNEAFAAQYLACEKLLGLDRNKVNVNGGAIALGHPIAMSGARITLSLAHELKRRGLKRGIAALCIGGGMGIATLIENPDVA